MGYSLAVKTRNPKLAKKMLSFMGEHYRDWSRVIGQGKNSYSVRPLCDDISYGQNKGVIGFDYSAVHGWERAYVYSLCRWIALKIGVKKSRFSKETVTPNVFEKGVPYISYDGYEHWPIFVASSEKEAKATLPRSIWWCATDRYGLYLGEATSGALVDAALENLIFDKDLYKKMQVDWEKLGPWPEDRSSKEYDRHLEKYKAVKRKHAKPEIRKVLPIVRAELKRLDDLWEAL